jgi:hypothetical protein
MARTDHWLDPAFEAIAIDDDGRACEDIPQSACRDEAGNFFTHVAALSLSKSSDSLIDPKLVLSWLISSVGAPPALVGLLVPIREAGALLPQIFTAARLRRLPLRKWAWTAGAIGQGVAAIGIAACALLLSGRIAGIAILACLAVLSLARSVCSVCYKDVLGKTVDKSRRGRATGTASTLAAIVAIAFAVLLFWRGEDRYDLVITAIFTAGGLWIGAGLLFATLAEEEGAQDGGANAFRQAIGSFTYLKTKPQLRVFILTRALLTATAFAPPFMVALATDQEGPLENLGLLVFASALAALSSSFIWGRLSDRSSRKVLLIASALGAAALTATVAVAYLGLVDNDIAVPVLLFALMISYQGVRLGRSTHLVDMADTDTRAAFTALSNTAIGLVLLLGGAFSLVAELAGLEITLAILAAMCALACLSAARLEEVQT